MLEKAFYNTYDFSERDMRFMYVYVCLRVCVCMYVCLSVYVCLCLFICLCVYVYVCVCMSVCVYVCMCVMYVCVSHSLSLCLLTQSLAFLLILFLPEKEVVEECKISADYVPAEATSQLLKELTSNDTWDAYVEGELYETNLNNNTPLVCHAHSTLACMTLYIYPSLSLSLSLSYAITHHTSMLHFSNIYFTTHSGTLLNHQFKISPFVNVNSCEWIRLLPLATTLPRNQSWKHSRGSP